MSEHDLPELDPELRALERAGLVARVVPPTARVHERLVGERRVERATVELVAGHVEERVVATALLPHEVQQVFVVAGVAADRELA